MSSRLIPFTRPFSRPFACLLAVTFAFGPCATAHAGGASTTTLSAGLCGPVRETTCTNGSAGKSVLLVGNKLEIAKRLKWKLGRAASTDIAEFGDLANGPATIEVCLYDDSANPQPLMRAIVDAGGSCDGDPCWLGTSSGFKYRNSAGNSDGITGMKLRAGPTGRAQVQVLGKGPDLLVPALPLAEGEVVAQLMIDNGSTVECWQTRFPVHKVNSAKLFKAKGP
jgi:hypothetical protein